MQFAANVDANVEKNGEKSEMSEMEDFEKLMEKTVKKYLADHPEYVEQMSQAMVMMMLAKMQQALEKELKQVEPISDCKTRASNNGGSPKQQRRLTREEFLCLDEDGIQGYDYRERADVSELNKLGYSVSRDNPMSDRQRQELLALIVKSGKMSKGQVLSHLHYLIKINGKSLKNDVALGKWKKDYDFVRNL